MDRSVRTLEVHVPTWPEGEFSHSDARTGLTILWQLAFMIVELVIGVAIGFIPCKWHAPATILVSCADQLPYRRGQLRYMLSLIVCSALS